MKQAAEIEQAFIREFSVNGIALAGAPPKARQERIRVAILTNSRTNQMCSAADGLTYAEAFRVCYGSEVELRGTGYTAADVSDDLDETIDEEWDDLE